MVFNMQSIQWLIGVNLIVFHTTLVEMWGASSYGGWRTTKLDFLGPCLDILSQFSENRRPKQAVISSRPTENYLSQCGKLKIEGAGVTSLSSYACRITSFFFSFLVKVL